jgi:hypothetical protein
LAKTIFIRRSFSQLDWCFPQRELVSDLAVLRVLDIESCVLFGEGLVEKLENWKVSERDLLVQYQGVVELE